MRYALTSIVAFALGYAVGRGEWGILEMLYGLIWENALGEAIHTGVLNLEDARITTLYAAIRLNFRYGPVLFLLGLIAGCFLRGRYAMLPGVLTVGMVVRIWLPMTLAVAARVPSAQFRSFAVESAPAFVWDLTLIPMTMLGVAIARLLLNRHLPRWRIVDVAILMVACAVVAMAVAQGSEWLLPFAVFPLVGLTSLGCLLQTDAILSDPPRPATPLETGREKKSSRK